MNIIEDPLEPDNGEPRSYDVPIWAWVAISLAVVLAVLALILWVESS